MDDWEEFISEVTWFVTPGVAVSREGDQRAWTRGAVADLPTLSRLLAACTLTTVTVAGASFELLTWGPQGQRRGWLCLPPVTEPAIELHPLHRSFLSVCGGIIERFGEPNSWWSNQDEVLTEEAAGTDLSSVLDDYSWIWSNAGLEMPIAPSDYYVVAVEANGNLTLAHRTSSRILLFAPDHALEGVTPLAGCPKYSLMTLDHAPDLRTWIEGSASVWSST